MPQLDNFTYFSFFKYSILGLLLIAILYFLYQARVLGVAEAIKKIMAIFPFPKGLWSTIIGMFGK